jgi:hypothetical protein
VVVGFFNLPLKDGVFSICNWVAKLSYGKIFCSFVNFPMAKYFAHLLTLSYGNIFCPFVNSPMVKYLAHFVCIFRVWQWVITS